MKQISERLKSALTQALLYDSFIIKQAKSEKNKLHGLTLLSYEVPVHAVLSKRWITGGVEGGHYDEKLHRETPVSGEAEPEFEELDKVLEIYCPQIGFLQYKKLLRELVTVSTERKRGTYGDRTDYQVVSIQISELADWLEENKL